MKSLSRSSRNAQLRPEKVHSLDVHTVRTRDNRLLKDSLLNQSEYDAIGYFKQRHAHQNLKLSRKDNTVGLTKSVIFDEQGRAFALFRGKSYRQQLEQLGEGGAYQPHRLDVDEKKLLGQGAFGRVKICQDIESGKWYAVKIIPTKGKHSTTVSLSQELYSEAQALQRLKRLKGQAQLSVGKHKRYFFQHLIRGMDLHHWLKQNRSPMESERKSLQVALNAVRALAQCHQVGLLHRDIKLRNLMVDPITLDVSLVDFGFSQQMGRKKDAYSSTLVGTLSYIAPEISEDHRGRYRYSEATEVFSLGLVIGALLFGKDFLTDYSAYKPSALADFDLTQQDFLAQRSLDKGHPLRAPWVRFCQKLATNPTAKQLQVLPVAMQMPAVLVGQMISGQPDNRPSIQQLEKMFKKMLKVHEIQIGASRPSWFERVKGTYRQVRLKRDSSHEPQEPEALLKQASTLLGIKPH